tara:strand:- start:1070 stop:1381 length:312 start_codon:yes stop_codon:yes gene_type:complete
MNNYTVMTNKEDELEDSECMICFYKVDTEENYIKCYNCNKLFHKDCMDKWKRKTGHNFSSCIHCTKDELIKHEYQKVCCVGCWNWLFPMHKKKLCNLVLSSYD